MTTPAPTPLPTKVSCGVSAPGCTAVADHRITTICERHGLAISHCCKTCADYLITHPKLTLCSVCYQPLTIQEPIDLTVAREVNSSDEVLMAMVENMYTQLGDLQLYPEEGGGSRYLHLHCARCTPRSARPGSQYCVRIFDDVPDLVEVIRSAISHRNARHG